MDSHSVKRSRSSGVVLKSSTQEREQFCNRIGCKGRLSHTTSSQNGCSGKYKSSRSLPVNVSSEIDVSGSSSATKSVVGDKTVERSLPGISVERSNTSSRYLKSVKDSSEITSSSILRNSHVSVPNNTSNNRKKVLEKKPGIRTQSTLLSTSGNLASKSRSNNRETRRNDDYTIRHGLRNLKCNSISDVLPSGSSSFNSKNSKRKDLFKKGNTEESSSSSNKDKKTSRPFSEDKKYAASNRGISISDTRRGGSSVNSTRTIRRFPNSGNRLEYSDFTPQSETSVESSSSTHSMSFIRPGSAGPRELGNPNPLLTLENFRRRNVDGIAEALLALERIEQDEELTYEQLMSLDANLFLGGLGLFDQHREMRLDIDDMSYEELLALGEKMGSVSTALSEEAISKCLSCSIFLPKALGDGNIKGSKGDHSEVKCSICQEEYKVGDELGRMKCEHGYHIECINQWLRLKNWCPICKAPAAPPA